MRKLKRALKPELEAADATVIISLEDGAVFVTLDLSTQEFELTDRAGDWR